MPPLRILLVDDDPIDRELVRRLLARGGLGDHQLLEASTAEAALELARARPPQAALVDLNLPDADGLAVATRLCQDLSPRPRVVVLTGQPDERRAGSLRALGVRCVAKGELSAELLTRVLAGGDAPA